MRVAAAALALVLAGRAASACDSSTCSLLTRGQNGLLPRGTLQLDLSYRLNEQHRQMIGGERSTQVLRPRIDVEHRFVQPAYHDELAGEETFVQLDLAYGLRAGTTLNASLPLWTDRRYDVSHFAVDREYETRGVGDLVVGARHAFGPLVAGLALKAPTAPYRRTSRFDGTVVEPTWQPGSGSWDGVGSLQYGRRLGRFDLTLAGSYQRNGTSSIDYRFGDELVATAGAGRALGHGLSASLQAKLFRKDRSRYLGEEVTSTGQRFVYVTPGLRWASREGTSLYAYLPVPVSRHVNEGQLAPSLTALFGVSRAF